MFSLLGKTYTKNVHTNLLAGWVAIIKFLENDQAAVVWANNSYWGNILNDQPADFLVSL